VPAPGVTADELIAEAAAAELRSEHPLGRTIVAYAQAENRFVAEPERFDYTPGRGIAAVVGGAIVLVGNQALLAERGVVVPAGVGSGVDQAAMNVFVARDGRFLGTITIADAVRPEAKRAVQALGQMGIRTILLTGDAKPVAAAVASALGIVEFEAELLPEAKLDFVQALVTHGRVVAMVGDGVNDAPALTEATVGVAMGSGTDVARESADVVLLGNDLAKFVETLAIARRTRGIIWQNFVGTIAVDVVGVGLAACGLLWPLLAAFIHVASELTFILNSARLLPSARSGQE